MTNQKEENKNKDNINEETKVVLDTQRLHLENTTPNILNTTTKRINENVNEYQRTNTEIADKSIDTGNKYQQDTINPIQSIFNNYIELQKNIANT